MKDSCSCTAQNNDPATIADRPVDLGGDSLRTTVRITQMDCPTEQRLITDRLSGMNGVGQLSFNLLEDRKSTRLNSSHVRISYAVFCLKKKKNRQDRRPVRGGRAAARPEAARPGRDAASRRHGPA